MRKLLVVLCAGLALGASLPGKGPIPVVKPAEQAPATPEASAAEGEPQEQPAIPAPEQKPSQDETPPAEETPVPQPKPPLPDAAADPQQKTSQESAPSSEKDDTAGKDAGKELQGPPAPPSPPLPAPPPPPPIEAENADDFAACTAELTKLGVRFKPVERIDDGDGCGIDKPIEIDALSVDVDLEPNATLRCETALQLARMTRDMVAPAATIGLADKGRLIAVHHGSAYICRKRNGASEGKISEHARGNGVDIVSLQFEKATVPMFIAKPEDSDLASAFQRALNAFACLYFSTVLSPGSDAAHQDHLHLDVLERRGGYRYCR